MRKMILMIGVLLLAQQLFAAELVEAIVARVGDRVVTRSQYEMRLRDGLDEIDRAKQPDAEKRKTELRNGLLNTMIAELLIKDRADRLGLTVTDPELQEAVKRLREQYGIKTDQEFEQSLKSAGMTRPMMEARLRDTILTNKVFSRELRSRDEASDADLRQRYEREKEHYRLPERARLREIIVLKPTDNDASALDQARDRATAAASRARAGEDFGKLVAELSQAPSKSKGGDVGEVAKGELLPDLDKAVFNAPTGTILGPIETKYGFHVLKVDERLPSEVPGFETIKEKLRKDVSEESFQRDYLAYVENLRKDAFIQINEQNVPKI